MTRDNSVLHKKYFLHHEFRKKSNQKYMILLHIQYHLDEILRK